MSQQGTSTSEQILAAATQLLLRHGDRFSVRSVATEANVSRATVHNLFPTKETLYIAAIERELRNFDSVVPEPGESLQDDLTALATRLCSFFQRHPLILAAYLEMSRNSSIRRPFGKSHRRLKRKLIILFATHRENGRLSALLQRCRIQELAEIVGTVFLGGILLRLLYALAELDSTSFDAEAYVDLFLSGYAGSSET